MFMHTFLMAGLLSVAEPPKAVPGQMPDPVAEARLVEDTARSVGFSEVQVFMLLEAHQGARGQPLADVLRRFGLREIEVFLFQEAMQGTPRL